MSKTSNSFPSNRDRKPEFSIYNSFDCDFPTSYDEGLKRPYYFCGRRFGEDGLIWLPLIYHGDDFGCNVDPGETRFDSSFKVIIRPDDRLAERAKKLASKHAEPGLIILCKNGDFHILCTSFYDPEYNNLDYVARIFNAQICHLESRVYWSALIAQINDAHVLIGVRYAKGKELDWEKAVDATKSDGYYGDDWGGEDTFSFTLDDSGDDEDDDDDCDEDTE